MIALNCCITKAAQNKADFLSTLAKKVKITQTTLFGEEKKTATGMKVI